MPVVIFIVLTAFVSARLAWWFFNRSPGPEGTKQEMDAGKKPADTGNNNIVAEKTKEGARAGNADDMLQWARGIAAAPEAEKIISAAALGGAEAFYKLGCAVRYDKGKIFRGDKELAMLWITKAAGLNQPDALDDLGDEALSCKNYPEAARYYSLAIKNGSEMANLKHAYCMMFGLGVPKDVSGGFELLREISEKDSRDLAVFCAKASMETGTVSILLISPFLDSATLTKLGNKDGSCNIPDMEEYFSGERISEKYTTGTLAYIKKPTRVQPSPANSSENKMEKPMSDRMKTDAPPAPHGDIRTAVYDAKKLKPEQIKTEPVPMPPPQGNGKSPMEELQELIGLEKVKATVQSVANQMIFFKMRQKAGLPFSGFNLHFVFSGNPGTGKTTVARILGRILKDVGYLEKGHVVEVSDRDVIGEYVGTTAPKMAAKVNAAMGGILFIDEAYSLVNHGGMNSDFGAEAISTLLKMMEDHREEFVVIAAGYPKEMLAFINSNPGFKSRFSEFVEFDDYPPPMLGKIFLKMAADNKYVLTDEAQAALTGIMDEATSLFAENFPNARFVRNLFEDTVKNLANRVVSHKNADISTADLTRIEKADLDAAFEDARISAQEESVPIGFNVHGQ